MVEVSKKSFDILKKTFDPEYKGYWTGNAYQIQIFMNIYIKENYKEDLFFIPFTELGTLYGKKKQGIGGGKNGYVVFIEHLKNKNENYVQEVNKKSVKNELLPYIKQYQQSNKRFHFFDITMILWVDREDYHSVSALYDKKTNQIDFFNTTPAADLSLFNTRFQRFFKEIYGKGVKLNYSPECLKFGETPCSYFYKGMNFEIEGSCVIWTMWFLELRLKHKSLSREDIVVKALSLFKKKPNLVCQVIYDYAVFVDKITSRYNVKKNSKTGEVMIEYKKTPQNNKLLKMILAGLGVLVTSSVIARTIGRKKLNNN